MYFDFLFLSVNRGGVFQRRNKRLTFCLSFDIISIRWNDMDKEINHFLDTLDRSPKTIFAYRNGLSQFVKTVGEDAQLTTETYVKFLISLKQKSPSTQRVYRTAVLKFYAFCKAGNWAELQEATQHYTRKPGRRIVNFNREAVEKVITYCESLNGDISTSLGKKLEALRDRAFVLTLEDTGLRISDRKSVV